MQDSKWYILSKYSCVWCDKAIEAIRAAGGEYEVGTYESHPKFFRLLMLKADLTTVPQIWYGDTYVGGYENLKRFLEESHAIGNSS